MTTLWLIRHSAPTAAFLRESRCYGVFDVPLDYSHFSETAARLRRLLPPTSALIASPRDRCQKLARAIRTIDAAPFITDARIAEMDFGRWENVRWGDVPRTELDAWAADFWGYRAHGGESVFGFVTRVKAALVDAITRQPSDETVWVTHQGVIRSVRALTGEGGLKRLAEVAGIGFGETIELRLDESLVHPIESSWREVAQQFA